MDLAFFCIFYVRAGARRRLEVNAQSPVGPTASFLGIERRELRQFVSYGLSFFCIFYVRAGARLPCFVPLSSVPVPDEGFNCTLKGLSVPRPVLTNRTTPASTVPCILTSVFCIINVRTGARLPFL
jgi:hypothetical protein